MSLETAVEQVIDHRTTLRYLGVPLGVVNGSDASWMFGDNLSVVNSTVMPNGKLQKRSHLLNYHICREAQASGIINFAHIDGKDNPDNRYTAPAVDGSPHDCTQQYISIKAINRIGTKKRDKKNSRS